MKTILITGATAGIGKASAELFAANGWRLILTGRRKERLNELSASFTEKGVQVKTLCFDVCEEQAVRAALTSLDSNWRMVDVLLNNAGLAVGTELIQDGLVADWERMLSTNVNGLLYVSKYVINWMIAQGSGHIINLGSVAGKDVYKGGTIYCASKFAVDAISKGMRIDLLAHGIKVTSINPGKVETEFSIVRFKGDEEKAKAAYEGFQALSAEDVAETIYFAASRPAHVNINEVILTPKVQANSFYVNKP